MVKPTVAPAESARSVAPAAFVIRSAFSPRERELMFFAGLGKAQQSMKDECDVNLIMKRFVATGVLPEGTFKSPVFGDVTGLNFRAMMDVIAQANAAFAALPADVRKRFGNDPGEFVEFCTDPANGQEMVDLGLAEVRKDRRAFVKGESTDKRRKRPGAAADAPVGGRGGDIPPAPGASKG